MVRARAVSAALSAPYVSLRNCSPSCEVESPLELSHIVMGACSGLRDMSKAFWLGV
jgi:hypothetical protein